MLTAIILLLFVRLLIELIERKNKRLQSRRLSTVVDVLGIAIVFCVFLIYLMEPNYLVAAICAVMLIWCIFAFVKERFSKGE